jgi:hypothetical protein
MQKWEYLEVILISFNAADMNGIRQQHEGGHNALFKLLGEQGWEMVAVTSNSAFYFKRPKQ